MAYGGRDLYPDDYFDIEGSVNETALQREIDKLRKELEQYQSLGTLSNKSRSTPKPGKTDDSGFNSRRTSSLGLNKNESGSKNIRFEDESDEEQERHPSPQESKWDENVTNRRKGKPKSRNKSSVKPATYDGQSSWIDYESHFDACAKINGWGIADKGLYLAVSLRGQAQGVLGNLPIEERQNFKALSMALEERFCPSNQTELYRAQLRERRQRSSESISELGQDIRRLTNLAYPTAPNDVRETLAKEQFMDALVSSDMRLRVKQARPQDLNDAVRHAVELEAFNKAEAKRAGERFVRSGILETVEKPDTTGEMFALLRSMQVTLTTLQEDMNSMKARETRREQSQNYQQDVKCFKCGNIGHFARHCKVNREESPDVAGFVRTLVGTQKLDQDEDGLKGIIQEMNCLMRDFQKGMETILNRLSGQEKKKRTCFSCDRTGQQIARDCRRKNEAMFKHETSIRECNRVYTEKRNRSYQDKSEMQQRLSCGQCTATFAKRKYLKRHMRRGHSNESRDKNTETEKVDTLKTIVVFREESDQASVDTESDKKTEKQPSTRKSTLKETRPLRGGLVLENEVKSEMIVEKAGSLLRDKKDAEGTASYQKLELEDPPLIKDSLLLQRHRNVEPPDKGTRGTELRGSSFGLERWLRRSF